MRRISLALAFMAAIAASYELGRYYSHSQMGGKTGRHVLYYTDPMHPAYKSDRPGIAPDCGMKLEPVFAGDGGNPTPFSPLAKLPTGAVGVDGATQRLLGIRLATVERAGSTRIIRAVGRVVPEDTRVYKLNPGVDGFVRETYDDSVGMLVKKDQRLATYYSPEFLSVASGFLAAVQNVPGAVGKDGARTVPFPGTLAKQGVSSLQGYIDRLRNLGMSDVQIKRMADSHQLPESIDVVAPADGFILSRNISPGLHFERQMEFYRVADLSRVWVVAEVYEQEAAYPRPGDPARIILRDSGRQMNARIAGSLPQSEAGGGTVKLRLEVDNPAFVLRPDKLVDVELSVRLPAAVTVPLDSLVDSGDRTRVYVEHGQGIFEPREVETGWRFGERVEVRRGLQPGERVVVAAAFLVDSESRLKTPAPSSAPPQTMDRPVRLPGQVAAAKTVADPNCGMAVDPASASASGDSFADHGTAYYFCSKQCKQAFQSKLALRSDPTTSAGVRRGGFDD